jgi:hypothetical protein
MKTKNILSTTILALAGIVLSAGAAKAETYANGDLLLSFRATGGTGATTNYVIDLGNASNYLTNGVGGVTASTGVYATGSIVNLTAANSALSGLGTDLGNIYGSNWNTRSDLVWSVTGFYQGTPRPSGVNNNTLFVSSAESQSSVGTQSTSPNTYSAGASSTAATAMGGMSSAYAGSGQLGATATAGQEQASGFTNSYGSFATGTYPTSSLFASSANFQNAENDFGNGTSNSVNDAYLLKPGAASAALLGGFELTNTGNVEFSSNIADFATPVPEPASAGMITAGLLSLVAMGKRRRIARSCQA